MAVPVVTDVEIRADHVCACPNDDPSLIVNTQRQGPQHIGVRFWNEEPGARQQDRAVDILLDGVKIYGVFEAIIGEQGTIWRYRGYPSAADRGRHRCYTCVDRLERQGLLDADGFLREPRDGIQIPHACVERLDGPVSMNARARQTCPGCERGGDESHTYAQGICTGGRQG